MDSLLDYTLRQVISRHEDLFGRGSTFLRFDSDVENFDSSDGRHSSAIFGCVVYARNDDLECSSGPLMVKVSPPNAVNKKFHIYAYMNETFFYTRILPFFESCQRVEHLFPKFYGCYLVVDRTGDAAAVVFENLQSAGYRGSQRKSFLDYRHLLLLVRKLAEFHAVSYRAKRADPESFYPLVNALTDINFVVTRRLPGILGVLTQRGLRPLRHDPLYSGKLTNVDKFVEDADAFVADVLTGDKKNAVSVLCHGDFLRSNVLFRYNDEGVPIDLKMIDLADCRYGSPVVDLALALYLHTSKRTREEHWDDLIDAYYESLYRHSSPDDVPSKQSLLSEFSPKAFYAYLVASYFLPQLLAADNREPALRDIMPEKYVGYPRDEIPVEHLATYMVEVGGGESTEALADILRHMIDRGFV